MPGGLFGLVVGKKEVLISDEVMKILKDPARRHELEELVKFIEKERLVDQVEYNMLQSDLNKMMEEGYLRKLLHLPDWPEAVRPDSCNWADLLIVEPRTRWLCRLP